MNTQDTTTFLLLGLVNTALCLWLLGYAASWFLYVLSETGSGKNEFPVPWPSESFLERFQNGGQLGIVLVIFFAPAAYELGGFELSLQAKLRLLVRLLLGGSALWLLVPMVLLSWMGDSSRSVFFRWALVLRRLRQRHRIWLVFYAYTAPLLLGGALLAYLSVFGWKDLEKAATKTGPPWLASVVGIWSWVFVPAVAAGVGAAALLIYARLVGRLAWLMDLDDVTEEEPVPEPKPQSISVAAVHDTLEPASSPEPPSAAASADAGTYALLEGPTAVVETVTEAVSEPEVGPEPVPPPAIEEPAGPPPPRRLWVRGIYRYPWYRQSLKAWLVLSLGSLALIALLRLQMSLLP
jgi:hypothetical protein